MKYKKDCHPAQASRNMIEMPGMLAIIGILPVNGQSVLFNMAIRKIRIQKFIEETQKFVQETYLLYENTGFPRESFKLLASVSVKAYGRQCPY